MFCCLPKFDQILYYKDIDQGRLFASSRTGEVYTKNTEHLYEEDFAPKDLVYSHSEYGERCR